VKVLGQHMLLQLVAVWQFKYWKILTGPDGDIGYICKLKGKGLCVKRWNNAHRIL
jgi:hypothetical protein